MDRTQARFADDHSNAISCYMDVDLMIADSGRHGLLNDSPGRLVEATGENMVATDRPTDRGGVATGDVSVSAGSVDVRPARCISYNRTSHCMETTSVTSTSSSVGN